MPRSQFLQYDNSNITDFVRYLACREIVNTGLIQFNDQPESYRAWQRSFCNAASSLNLTPSEEMDLQVKWLGKESTEHAKCMRSVHINQPHKGLKMIWDRLEECYSAPEVIESALFRRVNSFPKISSRDYSKLHELGDLLMEVESAKADGDLPGLSYLDTAWGINPIVQKVPFNLQEEWLSYGSSYKETYRVPFPPFSALVGFICQQARIRNDPGQGEPPPKADKGIWKTSRQKEISVYKTDLSPAPSSKERQEKKTEDAQRLCPIHKRPHLLRKCRALKEKGICFKCCLGTSHTAKICKYNVTCSEHGSEKHISALHPGPPPKAQEPNPSPKYGGEEDPMLTSEVAAHYTEVCGGDLSSRSCSKICSVNIFPNGHRDKALKVYVVPDEQSNKSLARSEFFDTFKEKGRVSSYTLKTCSGVTEILGRKAFGYQIESIDGKVRIPLPSLLECNNILNNRAEIPTPTAAR
ncbi:uncharacterized protein LOC114909041 [Scleropages formosus]|uniref:uncharacterized protein LOC114909041 n=1 Tax=Scleropages formosus TaxID=113540 RepID=UPI0008791A10|nr:uncharacterized protein LOC114909041 [Scleropages formosus]